MTNQISTNRVFTGADAFSSTVVLSAVVLATCLNPVGGLPFSMVGTAVTEESAAHISTPGPAAPTVTEAEEMFLAEPKSKTRPVPFGFPPTVA